MDIDMHTRQTKCKRTKPKKPWSEHAKMTKREHSQAPVLFFVFFLSSARVFPFFRFLQFHSLCCSSVGSTLHKPIQTDRRKECRSSLCLERVTKSRRKNKSGNCLFNFHLCLDDFKLAPIHSHAPWRKMLSFYLNFVSIKRQAQEKSERGGGGRGERVRATNELERE